MQQADQANPEQNDAYPPPEISLNARFPTPPAAEVVQFFDAAFRLTYTRRTSPETKFGERSSDAVQAYARVRAEHGKRRALPSPTAFRRVISTLRARHFKTALHANPARGMAKIKNRSQTNTRGRFAMKSVAPINENRTGEAGASTVRF